MSYQQLSADERFQLHQLHQSGQSMRAIGRKLGRSHTTISRELSRYEDEQGYRPDKAHQQAQWRRQQSKVAFANISDECIETIKQRLALYHSPEQIAGALKRVGQEYVSHETIYQMIYQDHAQMRLYLKYLRHRRAKKRKKRSGEQSKRGKIPNRVGIEQRPAIADEKREIGHWEGDTMIGAHDCGAIATYVDKASKYLIARVMPNRTVETLNDFTIRAFKVIGLDKSETMTFDNGKEFSGHEELAKSLRVSCYFANPYCSWERGLNEHTNGLLRQFFPKGTDFREVRQRDVDEAVKLINHRPRKALGYRTPHQVFWGQSGSGAVQI